MKRKKPKPQERELERLEEEEEEYIDDWDRRRKDTGVRRHRLERPEEEDRRES